MQAGARSRLEVIDWQGLELVPVQKDFSYEHPAVAARSERECEQIRVANCINVVRNDTELPLPKPIVTFEEAPFPDWAAEQLRRMGFERPTPIQVQAWPVLLKGHDFVGIAETGSGKTFAYLLPLLVHLMAQPELRPGEGPVALVLVPNRELCIQVAKEVGHFTAATQIVCRALYGGDPITRQERALAQRMDVAVVTPGRLIALLNSQATNLRRATFIVLDEADELLSEGFGDQLRLVMSQVRPDRQAVLFSATWHKAVDLLAAEVCALQPVHISVGSTKLSACKSVDQSFLRVEAPSTKLEKLRLCLDQIRPRMAVSPQRRALLFCNARSTVDLLVSELTQLGYPCSPFHGQQEQQVREATLRRFASPESDLWLLVCTQVLGRGHDFTNVMYVINYDMPERIVEYIHRIGRTGRGGKRGYAVTLLTSRDACVAPELAMVLSESGQDIPVWLREQVQQVAKHRAWRGGSKAHQWLSGTGPSADAGTAIAVQHSGDPAPECWGGRGSGRRGAFLSECGGEGLARRGPPSPDVDPGAVEAAPC